MSCPFYKNFHKNKKWLIRSGSKLQAAIQVININKQAWAWAGTGGYF